MKNQTITKVAVSGAIAVLVACSFTNNQSPEQKGGPIPTVEETFAKMDSNKDGKLSKEEVKGPLLNDFSKIDTNNDGYISKEELAKAPKPQGGKPPQN